MMTNIQPKTCLARLITPKSIRLPLVTFFSAFILHFIHIAFSEWGRLLISSYAFSDEYLYLHRAWHMAFVNAAGGYMGEILSITPYARLLTWTYQLLGHGYWVPFFVNAILMSFAVTFTVMLTRQLFDEKTAWIAAIIGVLCGPFIFFAGITYKTNLVLMFLAGGLYYFVCYLKNKNLLILFFASVFILTAAVERYQIILIFIVMGLFALYPLWLEKKRVEILKTSIVVLLSLLIVVSLSIGSGKQNISNMVSPVGINVYIGYSPDSWGGYTALKSMANNIIDHRTKTKEVAEKESNQKLSHLEVQWHWIRKSITYYLSVPQDLFILQARKLGLLFAQATQGQPEEYRVWRWQRPALMVALVDVGLIIALALFGIYHLKNKNTDLSIRFLIISIVVYMFSIWMFFINERYRMPFVLMLIPFSAYAISNIFIEGEIKQRIKKTSIVFVLYILTFVLNNLNQEGPGWSNNTEHAKNVQERRFDVEFKIHALKMRAIELNDEESWLNLAIWFNRRKFYSDAIDYAKKAINVSPESFKGYDLLIEIYIRNDNVKALAEIKRSLEKNMLSNSNKHLKFMFRRIDMYFYRREKEADKQIKKDRESVRDIIRKY